MKTSERHGDDTRAQLLDVACDLFAEKGFRGTTIAAICKRAGANIAAVNYHFRTKEALYAEAWQTAFHCSVEAHPPDGGVGSDAPPAEQLRGHVLSLMRRISDPASREFEIVQKEMANPTGLLAEVMRECIGPIHRELMLVVRRLLGERASESHVRLCQMSIAAQCFQPLMRERHRKLFTKVCPDDEPSPMDLGVEAVAEHITQFSLAAITELRKRIERGELADGGATK